jgi:hypothetical protein
MRTGTIRQICMAMPFCLIASPCVAQTSNLCHLIARLFASPPASFTAHRGAPYEYERKSSNDVLAAESCVLKEGGVFDEERGEYVCDFLPSMDEKSNVTDAAGRRFYDEQFPALRACLPKLASGNDTFKVEPQTKSGSESRQETTRWSWNVPRTKNPFGPVDFYAVSIQRSTGTSRSLRNLVLSVRFEANWSVLK